MLGDIDWQRNEIKISRAKTSAASEAEAPKTVSGNRDVRILAPAMEALLRQKQFTYMLGQQIFHDPRYDKPYTRRPGATEKLLDANNTQGESTVPQSISDQTHVCVNDVISW